MQFVPELQTSEKGIFPGLVAVLISSWLYYLIFNAIIISNEFSAVNNNALCENWDICRSVWLFMAYFWDYVKSVWLLFSYWIVVNILFTQIGFLSFALRLIINFSEISLTFHKKTIIYWLVKSKHIFLGLMLKQSQVFIMHIFLLALLML